MSCQSTPVTCQCNTSRYLLPLREITMFSMTMPSSAFLSRRKEPPL
ncbi:unnamed protein product, partial [Staurois parvus]